MVHTVVSFQFTPLILIMLDKHNDVNLRISLMQPFSWLFLRVFPQNRIPHCTEKMYTLISIES